MTDDIKPSQLLAFTEALQGPRGDFEAWLECRSESEVRAFILAAIDAAVAADRARIRALVAELREAHAAIPAHVARSAIDAREQRAWAALRNALEGRMTQDINPELPPLPEPAYMTPMEGVLFNAVQMRAYADAAVAAAVAAAVDRLMAIGQSRAEFEASAAAHHAGQWQSAFEHHTTRHAAMRDLLGAIRATAPKG